MGQIINDTFDPKAPKPIDSRLLADDGAARNAIPSIYRWAGMEVYVKSVKTWYTLEAGENDDLSDNNLWVPRTTANDAQVGSEIVDVYVDAVNGDDGTGAVNDPEAPFATCQAALTAAGSVEVLNVYVLPGTYTGNGNTGYADAIFGTLNLNVRVLNVYCSPGVTFDGQGSSVFDDVDNNYPNLSEVKFYGYPVVQNVRFYVGTRDKSDVFVSATSIEATQTGVFFWGGDCVLRCRGDVIGGTDYGVTLRGEINADVYVGGNIESRCVNQFGASLYYKNTQGYCFVKVGGVITNGQYESGGISSPCVRVEDAANKCVSILEANIIAEDTGTHALAIYNTSSVERFVHNGDITVKKGTGILILQNANPINFRHSGKVFAEASADRAVYIRDRAGRMEFDGEYYSANAAEPCVYVENIQVSVIKFNGLIENSAGNGIEFGDVANNQHEIIFDAVTISAPNGDAIVADGAMPIECLSMLRTNEAIDADVTLVYATNVLDSFGGGIALTDLSVGADALPLGSGGLDYNDTTGVFTYTPPDLSSFAQDGDYIPLGGTDVGSPVTGNIQFDTTDPSMDAFIFEGVTDWSNSQDGFRYFGLRVLESPGSGSQIEGFLGVCDDVNDGPIPTITRHETSSGVGTFFRLPNRFEFTLGSDEPTFKGIVGDNYYGANYTDNTYVQKKYVDDNFLPVPFGGTNGQVLTTDGSNGYYWGTPPVGNWSDVLAQGRFSGAYNPTISEGSELVFDADGNDVVFQKMLNTFNDNYDSAFVTLIDDAYGSGWFSGVYSWAVAQASNFAVLDFDYHPHIAWAYEGSHGLFTIQSRGNHKSRYTLQFLSGGSFGNDWGSTVSFRPLQNFVQVAYLEVFITDAYGITPNTITPLDGSFDFSGTTVGHVLTRTADGAEWAAPSSGGIALTDLSVGSEGIPSGDGSLSYDNATGVFTYTPPDLAGLVPYVGATATVELADQKLQFTSGLSEGSIYSENGDFYIDNLNANSDTWIRGGQLLRIDDFGDVVISPDSNRLGLVNNLTVSYLRFNSTTQTRVWDLPNEDGTLLVDAPSDGTIYGRQDGAWVEASLPAAQTWNDVLTEGAASGGVNPVISSGDYIDASGVGSQFVLLLPNNSGISHVAAGVWGVYAAEFAIASPGGATEYFRINSFGEALFGSTGSDGSIGLYDASSDALFSILPPDITANRTETLPDANIDWTGGSDGWVMTQQADGSWQPEALPSGVTDHGALTGLSDDDHTQYHTDGRALTWLGTRSTDDLPEGATNFYFPGFTDLLTDYGFTDNSANWNTAFGWGDHSTQGYLTQVDKLEDILDVPAYPTGGPYQYFLSYGDFSNELFWTRLTINTLTPSGGGALSFAEQTGVFSFTPADLSGYALSSHTHTASEITDFDTEVSNNSDVAANTAKVSFPGFTDLLTDYGFTDNSSDWDAAFSWGNHAEQNYLTDITAQSILSLSDVNESSFTGAERNLLWVNSAESALEFVNAESLASTFNFFALKDTGIEDFTDKNVLIANGSIFESRPLTEADISDFGSYMVKPEMPFRDSNLTKTSDDTLAADTQLVVDLTPPASGSDFYEFEVQMIVTCSGSSSILWTFDVTNLAGANMLWAAQLNLGNSTLGLGATTSLSFSGTRLIKCYGTLEIPSGGTAGQLQVQWAQNTASANPTSMRKGSFLRLTKLGNG